MNVFEVMTQEFEWIKEKKITTITIGSLGWKKLYYNINRFDYWNDDPFGEDFIITHIDNRVEKFLITKQVEYIEWFEDTNTLYFCIR